MTDLANPGDTGPRAASAGTLFFQVFAVYVLLAPLYYASIDVIPLMLLELAAIGFLFVIIFSFLTTDERSEEMWDELYVRQNTGINAESATVH